MANKSDKTSAEQVSAKKPDKMPETPPATAGSKVSPVKLAKKKVSSELVSKPDVETKASGSGKDNLSDQAKKMLATWTGKVEELKGLDPEKIYELYSVVLDEQRKKYPGKPEIEHHKRAQRFFRLQYKQKTVGSGRVKVSGIFYAFRGKINQVAKRRSDTYKDANLNIKKAAKDGIIMTEEKVVDGVKKRKVMLDEEGKPIPRDDQEFYKNFKDKDGNKVRNRKYGMPLPLEQWTTTYFGLFSIDDDEPQLAFYQMRGVDGLPGNCVVPMNVPVSFYAYSMNVDKGTGLKMINGFKTKFTIERDIKVPKLWEAYENGLFSEHKKTLVDLVDWCTANAKNFNAFFVSYVNFLQKNPEKNNNDTFLVKIDDESLGFDDESENGEKSYTSLTGFIPGMFEPLYNTFADLTSGVIIAAARRDFKKDEDKKVMTNAKGEKILDDPVVSIWGFDLDPEFTEKPREIDDASEDDLGKASGKSEHSDIDEETESNGLKTSKAEAFSDDDDEKKENVKKPQVEDDDDEDKAKKPSKKPAEPIDDDDDDEDKKKAPSKKVFPPRVEEEDDDDDIDVDDEDDEKKKKAPARKSEPDDDDIDEIMDKDVDAASE